MANAAAKKIRVQILPPPREAPHDDLRAGVVNANAEKVVTAVLDGNDISIRWCAEGFLNLAGIDPVMPMQNP
jgi:hypothetical protein